MKNNNFFYKSLTILVVFIIVYFCRPSVMNELEDIISPALKTVHYDSAKMKESKMQALNQVAQCNIKPENNQLPPATVTLSKIIQKSRGSNVSSKIANFMLYKVYRDLEQSAFLILQNMCELRRSQIQMINALSYKHKISGIHINRKPFNVLKK